jgi:hypothetical protein
MSQKLQFLDKRNDKGALLTYSSKKLSYEIAEKSFEEIKKYKILAILSNTFSEKYIEMYYKRFFYENSISISSQIVIHDHDKINNNVVHNQLVDVGSFPSIPLLKKVLNRSDIRYFRKPLYYFAVIKETIKNFLSYFKTNRIYGSNPRINHNDKLIGICYRQGHDIKKRSDIFWINDSNIHSNNLLIYYENKGVFNQATIKSTLAFFNNRGIKQVKLWQWKNHKPDQFTSLNKELSNIEADDDIEKWLLSSAFALVLKVNYWTSFFSEHNISIHHDPDESGSCAIIKQIAINEQSGVSFGVLRSYPSSRVDYAYGTFPNDIFFVWGIQSAKRMKETINKIDSIIISGFPYDVNLTRKDGDAAEINKIFNKNKSKLKLMILDSNHSANLGLSQAILTKVMSDFYNTILDWVNEDDDISLIIKPKKTEFFNTLTDVKKYAHEISLKSTRCVVIDKPNGKFPSSYLDSVDMVISLSIFLPSSVIECAIFGSKAVIFDNNNHKNYEKDLYKWGENKVIFSDLEALVASLKAYKKNKSKMPMLGDWSSQLNEIDPFCDSRGHERVGGYLGILHKGLQKGLSKEDAIFHSNKKYSEKYGTNMVLNNNRHLEG